MTLLEKILLSISIVLFYNPESNRWPTTKVKTNSQCWNKFKVTITFKRFRLGLLFPKIIWFQLSIQLLIIRHRFSHWNLRLSFTLISISFKKNICLQGTWDTPYILQQRCIIQKTNRLKISNAFTNEFFQKTNKLKISNLFNKKSLERGRHFDKVFIRMNWQQNKSTCLSQIMMHPSHARTNFQSFYQIFGRHRFLLVVDLAEVVRNVENSGRQNFVLLSLEGALHWRLKIFSEKLNRNLR